MNMVKLMGHNSLKRAGFYSNEPRIRHSSVTRSGQIVGRRRGKGCHWHPENYAENQRKTRQVKIESPIPNHTPVLLVLDMGASLATQRKIRGSNKRVEPFIQAAQFRRRQGSVDKGTLSELPPGDDVTEKLTRQCTSSTSGTPLGWDSFFTLSYFHQASTSMDLI